MQTSIWLNPQSIEGRTLRECVSLYACEMRKCEELQVMGYVHSNNCNLETRRKWLASEIFRLEEEIKRQRNTISRNK